VSWLVAAWVQVSKWEATLAAVSETVELILQARPRLPEPLRSLLWGCPHSAREAFC